jgi:uncharacterized phage protein (TIGR02218 family)
MSNWLASDLTTLAFLWRLERRDGVALGFTSHDRDLVRGGLRYRATPGLVPSAIERSDGFEADSVELSGALTSDALSPQDLAAGRWDGASLWLSAVDWRDPAATPMPMVRGQLGTVDVEDDRFSAELRGPTDVFDVPVVEETAPACRASLGDKRCRVDLAPLQVMATIVAASGADVTLSVTAYDGDYAFGSLRWIDGPNGGLSARIAANAGSTLSLREPPALPVTPGTRVMITQGCDRRFETCVTRFVNALNFRGEPHVPGNDLLTRYAT